LKRGPDAKGGRRSLRKVCALSKGENVHRKEGAGALPDARQERLAKEAISRTEKDDHRAKAMQRFKTMVMGKGGQKKKRDRSPEETLACTGRSR